MFVELVGRVGDDVVRRFRRNAPGLEIPDFQNVEKIADGGFSAIYRAYQPQFGRMVAIKVLPPSLRGMFERECETLGRLGDHPHVVRVFQAAVARSGSPYIVMEYLPAGSLADRLDAAGPLHWHEALAIGVKLAGVLQSAHEAGILHLDLKPANVLIGPDGEPKLADFGIARLRAALGATTQSLYLTPGYGAPELSEGEVAAACDVYGLGATLFALLKGHSPFLRSRDEQLSNVGIILGRQRHEPVPDLDRGIPEDVRAVVRWAMARSPRDRLSSAAEFGEALRTAQRGHGLAATPPIVVPVAPIPPQPPSPARLPRWQVAIASLLLALQPAIDVVRAVIGPELCTTAQADGVLILGTTLPRTGQFINPGTAQLAGAQAAKEDIDAAGGIPGITFQLVQASQPDEGNPSADTARQSTDELLAIGADVIIGPSTSASALRVIDTITRRGVIMFSPTNSTALLSTHPDRGLYFRTSLSDVFRKTVVADLVVADGNRTAVVMSRDDVWGTAMREATVTALENAGVTVLDSFGYDRNALDFDREVQRIKAKNPDAIVLMSFTESVPILRTMIEQRIGPQDKRVYGMSASMSNLLTGQVDPENPGGLAGMKVIQPNVDEAVRNRLKEINPGLQDFRYHPADRGVARQPSGGLAADRAEPVQPGRRGAWLAQQGGQVHDHGQMGADAAGLGQVAVVEAAPCQLDQRVSAPLLGRARVVLTRWGGQRRQRGQDRLSADLVELGLQQRAVISRGGDIQPAGRPRPLLP